MKVLVVYESIFGNTRRVAEAIAEGLRPRADVVLREVADAPADLADVDLLVVGGPTHAWGMSRPGTREGAREQAAQRRISTVSAGIGMREWIAALGPRQGARLATFDTAAQTTWFPTGSAARKAALELQSRGYRLIAAPEQFRVGDVAGPLVEGELERARAWGVALSHASVEHPVSDFTPSPRARPRPARADRRPSRAGLIAAVVVNAMLLVAAQMHHAWRPWLRGVVTARFADVLWVVDLSLCFEIAASATLLVAFRRWLRDALELARAAVALASTAVFLTVYPFEFARLARGLDGVARVGLQIVLALTVVAIVVNFTRLVYDRGNGESGTRHAT